MEFFARVSWVILYREDVYVIRASHYEGKNSDFIRLNIVESVVSKIHLSYHLFVSVQMIKMHSKVHLHICNHSNVKLERFMLKQYQKRIVYSLDHVRIGIVTMIFVLHVIELQFGR